MRIVFFLFLLLFGFNLQAQSEIYYYKDSTGNLSYEKVIQEEFQLLKNNGILGRHSQNIYWFKIPSYPTDSLYIVRVFYERYNNAQVYQENQQIAKLPNERYLSYRFSRDKDVYIRIDPKLHDYIPIELKEEGAAVLKDKHHLILNSFYYGFAFLILIYNLCYFFVFKDEAFLDYALLLLSVSVGIFTLDGMLNFFGITGALNNVIMILNYFALAYFSAKFAKSYLFLGDYYPKIIRYTYVIGCIILVCGFLYLFTLNYYYLLTVNILVFSILLLYWILGVFMFKKSTHNLIFVIAYSILLFSGFDYYFLKFLGFSIMNTNAVTIKIGAFIEMIMLAGAVLYRMNVLNEENERMRNEIIEFSKIQDVQQDYANKMDLLSTRERQIFNLIATSYSNKEIANELNVSINTVKFHVKNIYEKVEIKNRKEALSLAEKVSK